MALSATYGHALHLHSKHFIVCRFPKTDLARFELRAQKAAQGWRLIPALMMNDLHLFALTALTSSINGIKVVALRLLLLFLPVVLELFSLMMGLSCETLVIAFGEGSDDGSPLLLDLLEDFAIVGALARLVESVLVYRDTLCSTRLCCLFLTVNERRLLEGAPTV